jgi:hypothetical protein
LGIQAAGDVSFGKTIERRKGSSLFAAVPIVIGTPKFHRRDISDCPQACALIAT